jgi:hypothetical protein
MHCFKFCSAIFSALLLVVAATDYQTPPPLFAAKDYTRWSRKYGKSKRAEIKVPFVAADGSADEV